MYVGVVDKKLDAVMVVCNGCGGDTCCVCSGNV